MHYIALSRSPLSPAFLCSRPAFESRRDLKGTHGRTHSPVQKPREAGERGDAEKHVRRRRRPKTSFFADFSRLKIYDLASRIFFFSTKKKKQKREG